jgi:hypothetical protein
MARKLRKGIWDEKGIGKSSTAERSSGKRIRLNDKRSHGKQIGMGGESERDGAELRRHR